MLYIPVYTSITRKHKYKISSQTSNDRFERFNRFYQEIYEYT